MGVDSSIEASQRVPCWEDVALRAEAQGFGCVAEACRTAVDEGFQMREAYRLVPGSEVLGCSGWGGIPWADCTSCSKILGLYQRLGNFLAPCGGVLPGYSCRSRSIHVSYEASAERSKNWGLETLRSFACEDAI